MHNTLEFKEGGEAYCDGTPLDHNPYDVVLDRENHFDWHSGWLNERALDALS